MSTSPVSRSSEQYEALETRLQKLKAYREDIYQNYFQNVFLRKLQTWKSGLPKKELLRHLGRVFGGDVAHMFRQAKGSLFPGTALALPPSSRPVIVVAITGGIGDLILAARFLDVLCEFCTLELLIEHSNLGAVSLAFSSNPYYRGSTTNSFDTSDTRCVARLHIGLLAVATYIAPHAPPALTKRIEQAREFANQYSQFVSNAPFLDGLLGDILAAQGIKRHQTCFTQFGLPYSESTFLAPRESDLIAFLTSVNLRYGGYITVNDGWDSEFPLLEERRPTKALPIQLWTSLLKAIRAEYPDTPIVQIGGPAVGANLDGVTLSFRGKRSLSDSARLLAGAQLHIDTEGGLVHLANAVGTNSLVFFGPTSPDFFSYEDNQAVTPHDSCYNCWWSTNTWMAACPLHLDRICMDKHSVGATIPLIREMISPLQQPACTSPLLYPAQTPKIPIYPSSTD